MYAMAAMLLLETGQDAGDDERRFSAAGAAVNDDKPLLGEAVEDSVDHGFTAIEDRPFMLLERAQARIGRLRQPSLSLIAVGGKGHGSNSTRPPRTSASQTCKPTNPSRASMMLGASAMATSPPT